MNLNLKTIEDLEKHFAQCQHVDSIHSEYGMAKIIWCPNCGALMSPHEQLIKHIARRRKPVHMIIGSFDYATSPGVIQKQTVYAVVPNYMPHVFINLGAKSPIITGGKS